MGSEESGRLTKQERREQRRRVARRRHLLTRLRRTGIAVAVLAIPGLLALESFGPQEVVEAEVIETRLWRHYASDRSSHQHTAATLRIEGLSEVSLDRADGYQRGKRVAVWIRRGRISGWPYFLDVAKPGEIERQGRREKTKQRG